MKNKEYSPFTPGNPVPVELFVGRSEKIKELLRYAKQSAFGKQENIFLSGDRGIGKSSLASFLRHLIVSRESFLGIHIFLGEVSTLDEMVRRLFEQLLKETQGQKWFKKISELFGKYVQGIGLFGISLRFSPPKTDLEELVCNFPEALNNLIETIKDEKNGLFIALDDINGLAEKEEFANWYKSFVDKVATHYEKKFPVFIMLIGTPEKKDVLYSKQQSLMRIFRVVDIEKLTDIEVKDFLNRAFNEVAIRVEPAAMDIMIKYASGLPILMQEIGDATFWLDTDGVINRDDAISGVMLAAKEVGKKYLDPRVYRAIRSERYKAILRKLGQKPLLRYFRRKTIAARLSENEKKVFDNFLKKLRKLGVIEPDLDKGRGAYRFVNEIYPIYIRMESMQK